jgi:transposase
MKRFTSPVSKVNAEVIGLDVHQEVIVACRLDRRGQPAGEFRFGGDRKALLSFLEEEVARRRPHFALEACGGFLWVYDLLVERFGKERVHLAQPRRIQMIANSSSKNDRNDAFWLAYLTFEGRLPEAHVPETLYRELRIASRERIHAVQTRSKAVIRLRSHLRQMGERMPTKSFATKAGRAFVEERAKATAGARGAALRELLAEIDMLDALAKRWAEELERFAQRLPDAALLDREIPGVGKVLSATILGETGDVRRFSSPKALGRYTGMTPSERSTGGEQIQGAITREGSRALRWALMEAVTHCFMASKGAALAVADWTRSKAKRLGKLKARVAAARKLAESIWRLIHHGETFDAAKPFGGRSPEDPAARRAAGLA